MKKKTKKAKAKAAKIEKPDLVRKQLILPADWVDRMEATEGFTSFNEFVRSAILTRIDATGLSEMPGWGMGRWKVGGDE